MYLAYAIEWMARQEKVSGESIQRLLGPRRAPGVRQTPAQLRSTIDQLSAQLGIPLQRRPMSVH